MKLLPLVGTIVTAAHGVIAILTNDYGYAFSLFAGAGAFFLLFAKEC